MGPNHPFYFQYMEFRKTMDIDHILDWQPPEVSTQPQTPKQPLVTGDHEGRSASRDALGSH